MSYYYNVTMVLYTEKPELAPLVKQWGEANICNTLDIAPLEEVATWYEGLGYLITATVRDTICFGSLCRDFCDAFLYENGAYVETTPYAYEYYFVGEERDDVKYDFGGAHANYLNFYRVVQAEIPEGRWVRDNGEIVSGPITSMETSRG